MDELFGNIDNKKQKFKTQEKIKKVLPLVVVFFVALSVVVFALTLINKNPVFAGKEALISNLKKMQLEEYTDIKEFEKLLDNLNNSKYESELEFKIDKEKKSKTNNQNNLLNQNNQNGNNQNKKEIFTNAKLKDLKFILNSKIDNKENKGQIDLEVKYNENGIFKFNFLDNGKDIAIFEPSYFQEYIGVEKASLSILDQWLYKPEQNLQQETKQKELLDNLSYNLNQNKKLNPAREIKDITGVIKLNLVKELENIDKSKFEAKRQVPTKYRDKDVKADNISIKLTKAEYNEILNRVEANTLKEIKENITNYPTFKFIKHTENTILNTMIKTYLMPFEYKIKETNGQEDKLINALQNSSNSQEIVSVENQVISNEQNIVNNQSIQNTGNAESNLNSQTGQLQNSSTLENSFVQNTINLNEENASEEYILNFYLIDGKNFKIDKLAGDKVLSTFELYIENDKQKEVVFAKTDLGKEVKIKLKRTSDDGTVYNKFEYKEIDKLKNELENEKTIQIDLNRNNNLDGATSKIVYRMNKNEFGNKVNTDMQNTIKFVDNIVIQTDKRIELLNTKTKEELKQIMEQVVFPQVTKVTLSKLYEMENLASITGGN